MISDTSASHTGEEQGSKGYPKMKPVKLSEDSLTDGQRKLMDDYNKKQWGKFRKSNRLMTNLFAFGVAGCVGAIYYYTFRQMAKDHLIEELELEVQKQEMIEK